MICSLCGGKTTVQDTGTGADEVIRRRKCLSCGHRFFTSECDLEDAKGKYLLYLYKEKIKKCS